MFFDAAVVVVAADFAPSASEGGPEVDVDVCEDAAVVAVAAEEVDSSASGGGSAVDGDFLMVLLLLGGLLSFVSIGCKAELDK